MCHHRRSEVGSRCSPLQICHLVSQLCAAITSSVLRGFACRRPAPVHNHPAISSPKDFSPPTLFSVYRTAITPRENAYDRATAYFQKVSWPLPEFRPLYAMYQVGVAE